MVSVSCLVSGMGCLTAVDSDPTSTGFWVASLKRVTNLGRKSLEVSQIPIVEVA